MFFLSCIEIFCMFCSYLLKSCLPSRKKKNFKKWVSCLNLADWSLLIRRIDSCLVLQWGCSFLCSSHEFREELGQNPPNHQLNTLEGLHYRNIDLTVKRLKSDPQLPKRKKAFWLTVWSLKGANLNLPGQNFSEQVLWRLR